MPNIKLSQTEKTVLECIYNHFKANGKSSIPLHWDQEGKPIMANIPIEEMKIALSELEYQGYIDQEEKGHWNVFITIKSKLLKYFETKEDEQVDENPEEYISQLRIETLKKIVNKDFNLEKLIKLLEEINFNYKFGNYISVSLLLRMLIDYVPPIFGFETFKEAISQHGTQTTKDRLKILDDSLRKNGDYQIHTPINKISKKIIPLTKQSVNFISNIDFLIEQIIHKL